MRRSRRRSRFLGRLRSHGEAAVQHCRRDRGDRMAADLTLPRLRQCSFWALWRLRCARSSATSAGPMATVRLDLPFGVFSTPRCLWSSAASAGTARRDPGRSATTPDRRSHRDGHRPRSPTPRRRACGGRRGRSGTASTARASTHTCGPSSRAPRGGAAGPLDGDPVSLSALISTRCTIRTVPADNGPPRLSPQRSSVLYSPLINCLSTA